jgi:SAM-dependent methyltransferase
MPAVDLLFSVRGLRKLIWRTWYPFLTRRLGREPVLFLNYAYQEDPALRLPLDPGDEADRGCIQLYHHVARREDLGGKDVLEVGCGHGGGASYLTRSGGPRSYTGVDLNPAGVRFCRGRHRLQGLSFVEGDAENLPFPDGAFDAVVNVESSHCYPDFPRFLSEVARVLRPGGKLFYADFRFSEGTGAWEQTLEQGPLRVREKRDISREVLRGMDMNSERSLGMVVRFLPGWMEDLGRDFAGIRGSRVYRAMQEGKAVYRSYVLEKS